MAKLINLVIFFSNASKTPSLNINEGKMPKIAIMATIIIMQKDNTFNRVKFNNEFASREVEDNKKNMNVEMNDVEITVLPHQQKIEDIII